MDVNNRLVDPDALPVRKAPQVSHLTGSLMGPRAVLEFIETRKISRPWYDMIYFGLTPGGSSTVHIYTQRIHRTTQ